MKKLFPAILKTGLLAGTLDILTAFLHYYLLTKKNPLPVLQYVASGFFGGEAFQSTTPMYIAGLLFHYLIAFLFTVFFFLIYPKIKLFHKNKWLTAIIYGSLVWCVMNLLIVPSSQIGKYPEKLSSIFINLLILIVCIGLPLSFGAARFYKKAVVSKQQSS